MDQAFGPKLDHHVPLERSEDQVWDGERVIATFECVIEALETRACSKMAVCFSEDAIVNDPFGTVTKGRPALIQLCNDLLQQFQALKYSCKPYFVNKNGLACKCSTALVMSTDTHSRSSSERPPDQASCVVLLDQIITGIVNAEYQLELMYGLYNDTAFQLEVERCSSTIQDAA
jgi:hypothetical protein